MQSSSAVRGLLKMKGYKIFDRPFELNIVGIRNNSTVSNRFDDRMVVFWKDSGNNWNERYYPITTDPGTYYLQHPINVDGTAILKEGQYIDSWQIGLHKGQYPALVQSKPITVIRDYDRTAVLDFANGKQATGMFGINMHHASATGSTGEVGKWSAGCQVFQNISDFTEFMALANRQKTLYGNAFTYTLIDQRAITRTIIRRSIYGVVAAGVIIGVTYYFAVYRKKATA